MSLKTINWSTKSNGPPSRGFKMDSLGFVWLRELDVLGCPRLRVVSLIEVDVAAS